MTPALEALIAEAERLHREATPGEWRASVLDGSEPLEDRIGVVSDDDYDVVAHGGLWPSMTPEHDARAIAGMRNILPALASALRRAERVVEAARDARMELGRAWQDWDADRDAKAGKRIANAATTLIDAIHAHDHPDATGETGRK